MEADASGLTSTFLTDDIVTGGASEHKGKWLVFTSGDNNDGSIRQVTGSSIDTTTRRATLTFRPEVTDATANGDTAELWDERYDPSIIHQLINDAIIDATGLAWDPVEDTSLFSDGIRRRFDVPDGIEMVTRLEYRSFKHAISVHQCERVFDETADSDFTRAVDTKDFRRGSSLKLTIGAGVSAGDFVTDSIDSKNLSDMTHLEGWVKATTALAAADFVVHMDSQAITSARISSGDVLESLSVPVVAADTWTRFSIPLANSELDTAIISIGFEYNANETANTVWFDEIEAVRQDDANWAPIPWHLWSLDRGARDLVLTTSALRVAPYNLLKLVGGDIPVTLDADATAAEIDDFYIIAYATAHALMSKASGTRDGDAHGTRASLWFRRMEQAKRALNPVIAPRRLVS